LKTIINPPLATKSVTWHILGIGNDFRGDDGFGLRVAKTLQTSPFKQQLPTAKCFCLRGDISELMFHFESGKKLIMIDAIHSTDHRLGELLQFNLGDGTPFDSALGSSTHLLSVSEAISMADVLDIFPEKLLVLGLVSHHFKLGTSLSEVAESQIIPACHKVCELIKEAE